jgi:endogenous inhibitor of DNA gyrase (YacG/DUF329 family)
MKLRVVNCPRCGEPVEWSSASPWRPFCSQRCKVVDLGAWATEQYRVPVEEDPDDPASAPPDAEQQ